MNEESNLYKLSVEFFFTFARFESALKIIGLYEVKPNRTIEPFWNKFARDIADLFLHPPNAEFDEAVNYIENNPPKSQIEIEENGHKRIAWAAIPVPENPKSDKILTSVRRVRNNLFHGGKFRGEIFDSPDRSEILIKHSLTILKQCLKSNSDLEEVFNSRINN